MSKAEVRLKTFHPITRADWRAWLRKHHASATDVWMVTWKRHTGKPAVDYGDAVDEALCFGWVDSLVRRLDDDRAAWRFSPRRPGSGWSPSNVARFNRLVAERRMTAAGYAHAPTRKTRLKPVDNRSAGDLARVPKAMARALRRHRQAWTNFTAMTPSQRGLYVRWVDAAKKAETRAKRLAEAIEKLARNQKPGLK